MKLDRPYTQEVKLDRPYSQEVKLDSPYSQEVKPDRPYTQEVKLDRPYSQEVKLDRPYSQEVKLDRPYSQEVKLDMPYSQEANKTHHETGAHMEPSGQKKKGKTKKHVVQRSRSRCLKTMIQMERAEAQNRVRWKVVVDGLMLYREVKKLL